MIGLTSVLKAGTTPHPNRQTLLAASYHQEHMTAEGGKGVTARRGILIS
ncbi:hypothetical protein GGQ88_004156 [Novosphingobium hassiacum]|uniref:Uncharacterized protein n=1 Tax=Novosphingobium hassiacum TaxID=173676 RepID=A0A7W5ZZD1_9SPHN|nr:hypothetical protein [Novosphingobium hassiacum]